MKNEFKILSSKEYGASFALLQLAKSIGLDKTIYSRTSEPWVRDVLAMVIGRIIYAGSKLSLTRVTSDSELWNVCGIAESDIDVDRHCYESMDQLFRRQEQIQKKLAAGHVSDNSIILYDITSSYLEGAYEQSDLVAFGYNRDKKRGHEQIVIGLICAASGCPVAVEVFKGNTKDESTVQDKIREIKQTYGISNAVFVGDRGMVTKTQWENIQEKQELHIKTISALTHAKIKELCESEEVELSMFDDHSITEVQLAKAPGMRYGLCKNPCRGQKEKETRESLLGKTKEGLDKICAGRKTEDGKLGIRIGKIINKYKVGKLFETKIVDGKLTYRVNEEKLKEEEALDGLYVIFTDIPKVEMDIQDVVVNYRKLSHVEQAFRNLKSTQLEIRPIYHRKDDRIKSHVFLCMLSYYLLWHMYQKLEPLTEKDGLGKGKEYTTEHFIERLKAIRKEVVDFTGIKTEVITERDKKQQIILDLMGVIIK